MIFTSAIETYIRQAVAAITGPGSHDIALGERPIILHCDVCDEGCILRRMGAAINGAKASAMELTTAKRSTAGTESGDAKSRACVLV